MDTLKRDTKGTGQTFSVNIYLEGGRVLPLYFVEFLEVKSDYEGNIYRYDIEFASDVYVEKLNRDEPQFLFSLNKIVGFEIV